MQASHKCFLLVLPGAGEVHVSSCSEPGDGPQGPADSQQIPAHSREGSVPQESAAAYQGMDFLETLNTMHNLM